MSLSKFKPNASIDKAHIAVKFNRDGSIDKAHIVVKRFHQPHSFDYSETFNPVVKPTTIILLILLLTFLHVYCL